jgi:hypothetical protein
MCDDATGAVENSEQALMTRILIGWLHFGLFALGMPCSEVLG